MKKAPKKRMQAPTPAERFETQQNIHTRVELMGQEFKNHATTVSVFMTEQKSTNESLFNLIRQTGNATSDALLRIENRVSDKGKITAPFMAVIVSCMVACSGFVHWYVSSSTGNVRMELEHYKDHADTKLLTHKEDMGVVKELLVKHIEHTIKDERDSAVERARCEERISFLQAQVKQLTEAERERLKEEASSSRIPHS